MTDLVFLVNPEPDTFLNETDLKIQSLKLLREFVSINYSSNWPIHKVVTRYMEEKGFERNYEGLIAALENLPDSFYVNFIQGKSCEHIELVLFSM